MGVRGPEDIPDIIDNLDDDIGEDFLQELREVADDIRRKEPLGRVSERCAKAACPALRFAT